jgi:hypothetical protein
MPTLYLQSIVTLPDSSVVLGNVSHGVVLPRTRTAGPS